MIDKKEVHINTPIGAEGKAMGIKYHDMKIVTFDIETAPLEVYSWTGWSRGSWRAVGVIRDLYILSFASKFLGKKTKIFALPDYKGYNPKKPNDKALMKDMWDILDEADIVVGHNSNSFDVKLVNASFLAHGFSPPSPYKQVDTYREAKKIAKFTSNKLDDLGEKFNIGRKITHEGFELWKACMAGDLKAWMRMKRYNVQDVVLTEKLYLFLRPWMKNHPNVNKLNREHHACLTCGSTRTQKRGFAYSGKLRVIKRQRWQCLDCCSWSQGSYTKDSP